MAHQRPIPMRNDSNYLAELEQAKGPSTQEEQRDLAMQMGFNYRQVTGELTFAMVVCRPDISIPVTKISQYNENPAHIHYHAAKHVIIYLPHTRKWGLQ